LVYLYFSSLLVGKVRERLEKRTKREYLYRRKERDGGETK
jgi:hypothetical protein